MRMLQIEERKQHQARLLDKLSSIQVPGATTITTSPPRLVSGAAESCLSQLAPQ